MTELTKPLKVQAQIFYSDHNCPGRVEFDGNTFALYNHSIVLSAFTIYKYCAKGKESARFAVQDIEYYASSSSKIGKDYRLSLLLKDGSFYVLKFGANFLKNITPILDENNIKCIEPKEIVEKYKNNN